MRSFASTLLIVAALATLPLAAAAPAHGTPADDTAFYRFDPDRLQEVGLNDATVEARIVYDLDGRTLWSERFLLRNEPGDAAIFPLPNPAKVRRAAGGAGDLAIHVYVGDLLLDSFDPASFRAYVRTLIQSHGPEIERRLGSSPDEPAGSGANAATTKIGSCEFTCHKQYNDCVRAGGGTGCETGRYNCLLQCPDYDTDGDGVVNGQDNCDTVYNSNQANCDGDSLGDFCDLDNGTWQTIVPERTCWTDKDTHVGSLYFTFEHHVEKKERDVSSCGNPDRWRRRIRDDNNCYNVPDFECCVGLGASILAVGDSPSLWCDQYRDWNQCH